MAPPQAEFSFKEVLSDTAFFSDTVFRDNYVNFVALKPYQSISWKIGTDPREFTSPSFTLSFANDLGTFQVGFTGRAAPNTRGFPSDDGVYKGTKQITIVEQIDKANLTISPLVGQYRGAFTDTPNDIFTVRIDYFDSAKYDASITGSKNFYWISNFPKGYKDSTSSTAYAYPELRNGMSAEMGYKSLQFGSFSSFVKGKSFGHLANDTLRIYHSHVQNGRKVFIGKRI